MRIYDCFMYYDEETILDIRFNTLDKFVDYFVIVESKNFHNGEERKLRFDLNKYPKFKNKIIYIQHDLSGLKLESVLQNDDEGEKSRKLILNAHIRENDQRNKIMEGLNNANDNDLIMISDVDEIPNLEKLDFNDIKNEVIMFEQNIFYYKLNRYLPNFTWFGTKACKKKNLLSPQWLRNIKKRKYNYYRLDTFFSKTKYINKKYIKNGGWHFSNLKNSSDIELKLKSYLHHRDYEAEELGQNKIDALIKQNKTIYDMFGDKSSKKFGDNKRKNLEKFDINELPSYIQNNIEKFKNWID
jgi:beta-1,4-mannosyl-glycoprotein beta-1,4-N-acetylglucosaminyltransferase